jgi:peroxiredoxin
MPALATGARAPEISLPLLGGGNFKLSEALAQGPVLLAFFKISCPVCQMTFPYLERIHQAYRDSKVRVIGISQNDARQTEAFNREYGVTFPVALDDPEKYPASNAYGLTNVPTLFLVNPDGTIRSATVGWVRQEMEGFAVAVSAGSSFPRKPLFTAKDAVPDWKAG